MNKDNLEPIFKAIKERKYESENTSMNSEIIELDKIISLIKNASKDDLAKITILLERRE